MNHYRLSLLFAFFLPLSLLQAQEQDTLAEHSADSARIPIVPISLLGALDRKLSDDNILTDSTAKFREYEYLNDIVASKATGAFVRDLGSAGQFSSLTIGGLDGRSVAYMHNGILLNEPLTGTYNAYWFQTEHIERAEVETGTRSFLYGFNSTSGAINVVSKSEKAIRPLTRIRYSESRYEQTFFDGVFSQNLTRNLNLTGGVQQYVTDGRFRNSDYDMWGARLRARFDLTNRWNFFFSENYTQTQLGLFGGIDYNMTPPDDRFDRLQANTISGDTYEKITRHDLQLGTAALLFDDSTDVTTLTAFFSSHFREFRNENNRPNPDTLFIQDDHHLHWRGVRLGQHLEFLHSTLDLGGEIQSRQVIESPATGYRSQVAINGYGKIEFEPFSNVRLAGYARIDGYMDRTPVSYGADVSAFPFSGLKLFAGYSRSVRFPTFQELYWRARGVSGPMQEFEPERHHLIESGIALHLGDVFAIRATLYHRTVYDAIDAFPESSRTQFPEIEFTTQDKINYSGISTTATLRIWRFVAEGIANYQRIRRSRDLVTSPSGTPRANQLPEWWASGGIYFRDKLLDDHLDLKVGVRGRIYGEQQGTEFNPEAMMFVGSALPPLGIATVVDGILIAHIGSAYVHLIWQNLFDNNYAITPFYPMPDRAVRFGISWQLLD